MRRGLAAPSVVAALPAVAPEASLHEHGKRRKAKTVPVYGSGGRQAREHWATAMGIDWVTHDEMAQSAPPAYTELIGRRLIAWLQRKPA